MDSVSLKVLRTGQLYIFDASHPYVCEAKLKVLNAVNLTFFYGIQKSFSKNKIFVEQCLGNIGFLGLYGLFLEF